MTMQEVKPAPTAPQNEAALMPVEPPVVPKLIDRDDLLQIDGIDPVIEMALNSVGIRRFADFQGHTPQSLSQALQARTGISVSAEMIAQQDWLVWAEILAAEVVAAEFEVTKEEAMEELRTSEEKNYSGEVIKAPAPIASDMARAGSAEEALVQHSKPRHEQAGNETAINKITIRLSQVRFTPIALQEASAAASVQRLLGEINCQLAGITDASVLCAQIHAVDTAAGNSAFLAAKAERLAANQTESRFKLEFAAPPVGHYRLQIVAFLLQADPVITFWQGPLLRVLP